MHIHEALMPRLVVALFAVAVIGVRSESSRPVQTQTPPVVQAPPVVQSPPATQTPPVKPAPPKPAPPKPKPPPAAAASPTTGWVEQPLTVPVAGQAMAYVPRHPTTSSVVLFISGDGGWNLGVVDMARRIMPKAIVIGVSYNALRKAPIAEGTCWNPAVDLELIAQSAEKQLNLPEYHEPILVGYSSGATMVYHALVVLPTSFAGGLSLGFCPEMPANHNVCGVEGFKTPPINLKTSEVVLPKVDRLTRDWYVLNGTQDLVCLPAAMHKFLDDIVNVHPTIDIEGTGHGFSKPQHWGKPFDESMEKLLELAASLAKARK
jgi:hypothetical protein